MSVSRPASPSDAFAPAEPDAARPAPERAPFRAAAAYDYVLAVGPGRSGTTFLYRLLAAHPALRAPLVKEGYYYRSRRRFERARRRLGARVLLDVASNAFADARLDAVPALRRRGYRILLVVVLRHHRDQATSAMAYRHSRMPAGI